MKIATRETTSKDRVDSLSIYLGLPAGASTDELPSGYPPIYDGSTASSTTESDGKTYIWYDFQNHARGGTIRLTKTTLNGCTTLKRLFTLKEVTL